MFSAIRNRAIGLGAATLALAAGFSLPAQAAYVVALQQVGANVVATGSGTIDLAALTLLGGAIQGAVINPSAAGIFTGPTSSLTPGAVYDGITGPTSFGSGA